MFRILNFPFDPKPVLADVDRHVAGMSTGHYQQIRLSANSRRDIRMGKVGEFAARAAAKSLGWDCSSPDVKIYSSRQKSWDPDLAVTTLLGVLPLHTKSTGQMIERDLSWTFNWADKTGPKGRDRIFLGIQEDPQGFVQGVTTQSDLVMGVWVSLDCQEARVIWLATWKKLLSIGLRPPVAEPLRPIKKCVYMEDLLSANLYNTRDDLCPDGDEMVFRYPGGKTKLLPLLLRVLGQKQELPYREPYFGGGSVGLGALAQRRVRDAWINDCDPGIAAVWEAVRDHSEELQQRVLGFQPSVESFKLFRSNSLTNIPLPIVERALQKIAVHQMSFSGLGARSGSPMGGFNPPKNVKYGVDCRWSPKSINRKIQTASVLLQGVRVTSLDFEQVLSEPGKAFVYLDPPYVEKGPELYQYSHTPSDHTRLAAALKTCPHTWLLSYDDHPDIRRLYAGYPIFEIPLKYTISGVTDKQELLVCSHDLKDRVQDALKPESIFS